MNRSATILRTSQWLPATLVVFLGLGVYQSTAKPVEKAPAGAAQPADQTLLLEIVAHTEMKTTAAQQEAYAAALAKAAIDAFHTLHPVRRVYQDKLEDGTATYRLEIVHKGTLTAGAITRRVGPLANLVDKQGRDIQRNAGVEVEWSYPVDQNGTIRYRLLQWQGKPAGYKELLSWQNSQTNMSKFIAMKIFLMPAPPPVPTELADGERIVVAASVPALPMTAAEVAAAKKSAMEMIGPIGTRYEIQTAMCTCTLLKASAANRDIRGTIIGADTDAVQVRVANKCPWTISEIQVQVAFVQHARRFRAVLEGGPIEPGKSQTIEPSRPLGSGAIMAMSERNAAPPAPTTEVTSMRFDVP